MQPIIIYKLNDEYDVRPLTEAEVAGPYPGWLHSPEVCYHNSHGRFPRNAQYFLDYIRAVNDGSQVVWAIWHAKDGHVGNISLQGIESVDRTAEFAILLGDKRHWGRGVGALAGRQLLRHGFDVLNLERVHCGTAATNVGMQKLAAALGMTLEGTRRGHLYLNGRREDMLEYGVLRDEFRTLDARR